MISRQRESCRKASLIIILGSLIVFSLGFFAGCVSFEVTVPDTGQSAGGTNLLCIYSLFNLYYTNLCSVDNDGNILWMYEDLSGNIQDVEVFPNGNLLTLVGSRLWEFSPQGVPMKGYLVDMAHHDVDILPNGNIAYLFGYAEWVSPWGWIATDGIREIDAVTNETLWEWHTIDHVNLQDHCPICINAPWFELGRDWSHSNSFAYSEDGSAVYLCIRNMNRILKIDYPSGEVIWSLGDGGDFGEGLFSHPHDIELTAEGNIILLDNGLHRQDGSQYSQALELAVDEVAGQVEVVWRYRESPDFYCGVNGSADRLPNGNTLITDSTNGRLVEVLPNGERAWEMVLDVRQLWIFNSKRVFP